MGNLSNIAPRCKVGYFLCTEYIFIELATTFALVVCFLTALCAGGSFRSNQSQIVSVRYSFVISAGVANIVRTVIVSRFVLFVVATRTFMPVVSIIRLPFCACGMSESRNLHTGFIGNFYRSCCICEPLVTAIAGVVCGIARSSAGGSFRSNQSQIVSVRYSFVISAGVANIVRTVIVSRFVLFVVATRTFMPVVSIIRLPFCACGMSESRNLHTGFIGNFYRSCCICEPLVTAIAGVVCGIARSSAGGSFRSNQSQIVSVFFVFIFVIICNNRSVRNNRLIQAVNLYKFIIIKCFCRC